MLKLPNRGFGQKIEERTSKSPVSEIAKQASRERANEEEGRTFVGGRQECLDPRLEKGLYLRVV